MHLSHSTCETEKPVIELSNCMQIGHEPAMSDFFFAGKPLLSNKKGRIAKIFQTVILSIKVGPI